METSTSVGLPGCSIQRQMPTLIDLLERSVARYGERVALGVRHDDGTTTRWTYRDLDRRARIAAWRLRQMDLEPGDRILTWSPSTPELPAAYFGAMHARLVLVPLDLRMSADAVETMLTEGLEAAQQRFN